MFLKTNAKIHIFSKLQLLLYFQNINAMFFTNIISNTYTFTLLIVLVVSLVAVCLYYGLIWMRVGLYKNSRIPKTDEIKQNEYPSVSVVIVAQNDAEDLKKSLPYLLEQDYPDYEVVVVDYLSHNDIETKYVLRICAENYPNLKPISFNEDVNMFHGKKYPISIGIKSATKNVILLTEPDCIPQTFNWIKEMMRGYMRGADIVLGYCKLKTPNTLLGLLQQYDNMVFSSSYFGMTIMGNPYAATGCNLSYKRDFFFDRGAFIRHYSIPDGADDLFVNQNANRRNTAIILDSDSFVERAGRETFHQWHNDRKSRRSTRCYYPLKDRLLLSLYPLTLILFYLSLALFWIALPNMWQIPVAVLALKIIWQTICGIFAAKRFDIKIVQFLTPFFELYFLFANTFLAFTSLRRKK